MQAFRPRIRMTMLIVCAIVAPMQVAQAEPPLVNEMSWLPGDVDFVLGVRDMALVRATPLGHGATALVQTGIFLGGAAQSETLKAWRSLSIKLGFTEEQAFDALLGDRFFYASRTRDDGATDWVMYSRTSTKIARHVRLKLDVSPREIKHDRVLMSLEGGAFRLGSLIDGDNAWLMLAPTKQDGLFEQIASSNGQPRWENLGSTQPLREIRSLGHGELTLFATLGDDHADGWLGLVAKARGDSVSFRALSDPGAPLPAIEPWSTAIFDELRDGALYAQIERMPTRDEVRAMDHNGEKAPNSMRDVVRGFFEIPHRILGEDLDLILGHRLAIVVQPKERGGLSVGVGVEASDVKALAEPGDAAMRSMIDTIRSVLNAREAEFEFVGALPRAVRRITLKSNRPNDTLPPFGDELSITWSFRDTPGQAPAGWWVVGTDKPIFRHSARALTGQAAMVDEGESAAWLTLIEAHPGSMLGSLQAGGVPIPNPTPAWMRGLESVESFRLRTWIPEDREGNLILGAGSIRINEPANPRRGPRRQGR